METRPDLAMSISTPPTPLLDELPRHVPFLRRIARRLVRDADAVEDLVQDTLLAAMEKPPRSPGTLRAWLARVLRNKAFNHRRDDERRSTHERRSAERRGSADPARTAARIEVARSILDGIERLSPAKREVIVMRFYEDLPPRVIALRLGSPVATVKTRLKRALRELREELAHKHGEDRWRCALVATFGPLAADRDPATPVRGTPSLLGVLLMTSMKKTALVLVLALVGFLVAFWSERPMLPRDTASTDTVDQSPLADQATRARSRERRRAASASNTGSETQTSHGDRAVATETATSGPAVVSGRVIDETTGTPIEGARVRMALLGGGDVRRVPSGRRDRETSTDAQGRFRFDVDEEDIEPAVSVDARAAGYGSAAGPLSRIDHPQTRAELRAGRTTTMALALRPALYVEGFVVDEDGKLLADVEVLATEQHDDGYSYVARTRTDRDGRFRVYDFEPPRPTEQRTSRAQLTFTREDRLLGTVLDCYALDEQRRRDLRVVLLGGFEVDGFAYRSDGEPAGGLLVEAFNAAGARLRATRCGHDGGYRFEGLSGGRVRIRAIDAARLEKANRSLDLAANERRFELRLESFSERAPVRHSLLGLELVDVTPDLRRAFELPEGVAVLVAGAEPEHRGLEIGELHPGDALLSVAARKVTSVRDAVESLLEAVEKSRPVDGKVRARVVYAFRRVRSAGSNTQAMTLTLEQVEQLRQWLARQRD